MRPACGWHSCGVCEVQSRVSALYHATGRHVPVKNISCIAAHPSSLQFYIKTFTNGGAEHTERCLSHFPHPYPSLKGLQVRCSFRTVPAMCFAECVCAQQLLPLPSSSSASRAVLLCCPRSSSMLPHPSVRPACAERDHPVQAG